MLLRPRSPITRLPEIGSVDHRHVWFPDSTPTAAVHRLGWESQAQASASLHDSSDVQKAGYPPLARGEGLLGARHCSETSGTLHTWSEVGERCSWRSEYGTLSNEGVTTTQGLELRLLGQVVLWASRHLHREDGDGDKGHGGLLFFLSTGGSNCQHSSVIRQSHLLF